MTCHTRDRELRGFWVSKWAPVSAIFRSILQPLKISNDFTAFVVAQKYPSRDLLRALKTCNRYHVLNVGYQWNLHTHLQVLCRERGFKSSKTVKDFWESAPVVRASFYACLYAVMSNDLFSVVGDVKVLCTSFCVFRSYCLSLACHQNMAWYHPLTCPLKRRISAARLLLSR